MFVAGDVLDGHGEPWRERGRPGVERLPKSKRDVGTDSLAGRNAEGGNASTRCSVVLGNRPRVLEDDDLVDEPDCR